jgi:hypothetical protein
VRRKEMATNTSRTMDHYRAEGWEVGVVERFLSYAGKYGQRKDLFGIIDIIGINGKETIGIQSCGQAFSEHDKKIMAEPLTVKWLESGNRLVLIGWRKLKVKRGGKAMRWTPRIKEYFLSDFKPVTWDGAYGF